MTAGIRSVLAAAAVAAVLAAPAAYAAQTCGGWDSFTTAAGGGANSNRTLNDRGYLGFYQFGKPTLVMLGFVKDTPSPGNADMTWTGKGGIKSTREFLASADIQNVAYRDYTRLVWNVAVRLGLDGKIGKSLPSGGVTTQSGILMACQIGCGKVANYFANGMTCDGSSSDATGVCVEDFLRIGAGYDVSSVTGKNDVSNLPAGGLQCGMSAAALRQEAFQAPQTLENAALRQLSQMRALASPGAVRAADASGSTGTGTTAATTETSTTMTSRACQYAMPIITGIDCGRFPPDTAAFCNTYKPYLMTQDKCQEAEQWAQEQVQQSGGGTSPAPQDPPQPPDPKETITGSGGGGPFLRYGDGQVDNGDDGEIGTASESQPITPEPSQSIGGGPGGTPNEPASGQAYSGGPVSVGKIRAGNWAEACKKQTNYDGSGSWSYVLWCSQLKIDPPRRQSGSAPGIAGNLGYSGPGNTAGSGGNYGLPGTDGNPGTSAGQNGGAVPGQYNGTRPENGAKSSNSTIPSQDPECTTRLKAAGVDFTFEGFNQSRQIERKTGKLCFVATSVTVKKWSSVTMPNPVKSMNCPLAEKVEKWVKGLGIAQLTHMGSTSCRSMNGNRDGGTHLSMHSYGDAFDLASMDGQKFNGWNSAPAIQQKAWQAACGIFNRVLGPGYYNNHYVHFHVEQGHGGSCNR